MLDGRDVQMILTGAAALRVIQWIRNPNRPQSPQEEFLARQEWRIRFGLWLSRYARARERLLNRRMAPGWERDTARRWADRVPRMWL